MKISIHQPNYFPYPGFFHKLFLSDILVLYDDVQFESDITNKNKIIKSSGSWERISVPVKKNQTHKKIMDIEINNELSWSDDTFCKLYESYNKASFFNDYEPFLKNIYSKSWDMLLELNLHTIRQLIDWLGIDIKILKASELNIKGKSTERLVNICQSLDADVYVSGIGGKNYLNEKLFSQKNIKLEYQNYTPHPYEQIHSTTFVPNLSILDLLFNMGKKSHNFLKNYSS